MTTTTISRQRRPRGRYPSDGNATTLVAYADAQGDGVPAGTWRSVHQLRYWDSLAVVLKA